MYLIETFYKNQSLDVEAKQLIHDIHEMFGITPKKLKVVSLYKFDESITKKNIELVADRLLHDPIVQNYKISNTDKISKNSNTHYVEVWLKSGVTDTVADTVKSSMKTLGISKEIDVKTGFRYVFSGLKSTTILEHIARRLLANTTIHDYFRR